MERPWKRDGVTKERLGRERNDVSWRGTRLWKRGARCGGAGCLRRADSLVAFGVARREGHCQCQGGSRQPSRDRESREPPFSFVSTPAASCTVPSFLRGRLLRVPIDLPSDDCSSWPRSFRRDAFSRLFQRRRTGIASSRLFGITATSSSSPTSTGRVCVRVCVKTPGKEPTYIRNNERDWKDFCALWLRSIRYDTLLILFSFRSKNVEETWKSSRVNGTSFEKQLYSRSRYRFANEIRFLDIFCRRRASRALGNLFECFGDGETCTMVWFYRMCEF